MLEELEGLRCGCREAGEVRVVQDEGGEKAGLILQDFLGLGQGYALYLPRHGAVIKGLSRRGNGLLTSAFL